MTELINPRAEGLRETPPILLATRSSMDTQRTGAQNALTALLPTLDLGIDAHSTDRCPSRNGPGLRARQGDGAAAVRRVDAGRLASNVLALGATLRDDQRVPAEPVELMALKVLEIHGVGPAAAIILAAYPHHGWVRLEAALVALRYQPDPGMLRHINRSA